MIVKGDKVGMIGRLPRLVRRRDEDHAGGVC